MTATLLATLADGTLRIYTRGDDATIDQVGQLRTPLDHDGALRLMSDLDLLNGWSRNGRAVGGGGGAVVAAPALPAPRRGGGGRSRRDYAPILDAVAAVPGGLTAGEMAAVIGLTDNHGGFKTKLAHWREDGIIVRHATGERPGAGRARFRYVLATDATAPPAPPPRRVSRDRGVAAARRDALAAYAVEHGSLRSRDAVRLFPGTNDGSLHADLAWLVARGDLVRGGTQYRAGDPDSGYVWRPV